MREMDYEFRIHAYSILDYLGNEQSATFAGVLFRGEGAMGGLCGSAIPNLYDTPVEEVHMLK